MLAGGTDGVIHLLVPDKRSRVSQQKKKGNKSELTRGKERKKRKHTDGSTPSSNLGDRTITPGTIQKESAKKETISSTGWPKRKELAHIYREALLLRQF